MMLDYTVKMKPYRTSMKVDYGENRLLEVEAIFGNRLRKAQEKGVCLPQIECLYQQPKFPTLHKKLRFLFFIVTKFEITLTNNLYIQFAVLNIIRLTQSQR